MGIETGQGLAGSKSNRMGLFVESFWHLSFYFPITQDKFLLILKYLVLDIALGFSL